MVDILNIGGEPIFDDRIVKIETHTYKPYASNTFHHNDEIRIPIHQQDLYTLPCESFLYVEGMLFENESKANPKLDNNCVAFMFDEIRYEIDGVEIDRNRNVGITSSMKNFVSLTTSRNDRMLNAGWNVDISAKDNPKVGPGEFNFCVPLSTLLGFCEDYKRVIINARHELILIRARNDANCIITSKVNDELPSIILLKVQWRMPHVMLNDVNKLSILRKLESGRHLSVGFRSWDLYEYPMLQNTTKHSWAVKAATQLEKPRYVIFALQTDKVNHLSTQASTFDHCNLTNLKVYLNSEFYPYDDINLDFERHKFAVLYDMYAKFRNSYYGCEREDVYLRPDKFMETAPLVVIDCSHQNESIKSGTVDVRIEFECKSNIAANTTAYCLIIHDRLIEYNPLTSIVRKIV